MEILQFCLLASEEVWRGRTPFCAINSNRFGKDWSIELDYTIEGQKKEERFPTRTRTEKSPSRKIFRTHLKELLNEKLLVRIKTSDKRSKYYSITPLGICHLIKSELFYEPPKYDLWPEKINVFFTLETFAFPNVKPYRSIIFENEKFFSYDTDLWGDLKKLNMEISFRNQIAHVFSNIDTDENGFRFYVTNGYWLEYRIQLANVDFTYDEFYEDDGKVIQVWNPISTDQNKVKNTKNGNHNNLIRIIELNKKIGQLYGDIDYKPLMLDDDQFHHYLANLLICAFIYDYVMANFDRNLLQNILKKKGFKGLKHVFDEEKNVSYLTIKNTRKPTEKEKKERLDKSIEEITKYPEYFQKILILFSKHIHTILSQQYELMTNFSLIHNKAQFMMTRTLPN
ncbi:MAG: hypothetical protein WD512_14410 [Candidatus Paceibacterota bacterium]